MHRYILMALFLLISSTHANELHPIFNYEKPGKARVIETIKDNKKMLVTKEVVSWKDPMTQAPRGLNIIVYKGKENSKYAPVNIIFPPILGITVLERRLAKHLVKNGINAIILESTLNPKDVSISISKFKDHFFTAANSIRALVDHIEKRRDLKPKETYLWGTSLGSIIGSLVFSIEPRIKAATLLYGGANLADIMAESTQKYVVAYRNHRMAVEGISTVEEFRAKMAAQIPVDVLDYAHRRNPKDLVMGICLKDTDVPTSRQFQLWEAFGQPKNILYKNTHEVCITRALTVGISNFSDFITNRKY